MAEVIEDELKNEETGREGGGERSEEDEMG